MINKFFKGIKKGLPIGIAYFPFAFTFGFIATNVGINAFKSGVMSFLLYAGTSQVLIVKLLEQNSNMFQIILASTVINVRYILINMPILKRQENESLIKRFINAFFLTDECVSYMILNNIYDIHETIGFGFCAYLSFGISTILGSILGSYMPTLYTQSLNFILYAIFLYLLVQVLMNNLKYIFVVLTTIILKCILVYIGLSASLSILLSIILGALIPLLLKGEYYGE